MSIFLVGIDIGHGEVTASYIDTESDKREVMPLNIRQSSNKTDKRLPSLIYMHKYMSNHEKAGEYYYSLDNEGGIIIEFKGVVNKNSPKIEAFREFLKQIFERILERNADVFYKDGDLVDFKLYIAAPTKWSTEQKEEYRLFVEEAFGHKVEWVMNESDAAFFNHRSVGKILVIDYGSSTIDYTLMVENKKIPIDYLSNDLGASRIEREILIRYKESEDYRKKYEQTISRLEEHDMTHVEPDEFLKFGFRKEKERLYTSGDDWDYITHKENPLYKVTNEIKYKGKPEFTFVHEFCVNDLISEYKEEVKVDLEKLKEKISDFLDNGELSKIILSGGASQMPWFVNMVENVFNDMGISYDEGKGNLLVDRNNCAYVVSEGIVKYALAQMDCLNLIYKEIDKLLFDKPNDNNDDCLCSLYLQSMYFSSRDKAIKDCIKEELKKVCDSYANRPTDDSVETFKQEIKECFNTIINSSDYQNRFKQILGDEVNLKILKFIKKAVFDIFGEEIDINNESYVKNCDVITFGELNVFYNKLNTWFEEIYIKDEFNDIRKKEFDYNWREYLWFLREGKARRPIMRKHLANEFYKYVTSDNMRFDYDSSDIDDLNKISIPLKQYVKQTAEDLFYKNELFKTTFMR